MHLRWSFHTPIVLSLFLSLLPLTRLAVAASGDKIQAATYHHATLALNPSDKPWSDLDPSPALSYQPCFDNFQCARLLVPMDWNRTSDQDPKVAIAIIKLPAKVDVIDPRYGGAVIYNPGGPGASGVQAVLDEGYEFQTIVDSLDRPDSPLETGEAKYFDIIGFDPRGVNHTVPAVACFPSSLQRLIWKLEHEAEGRLNDPRTSLDQKWARYKSRSASCLAEADEIGKDSVAYHLNAAPVARDIIEIAERHGQWRESHAADLVADKSKADTSDHQAPFGQHALRDSLQAVRWQQGKEKVQFWGTSYGTALGATLAAMYPERVHRALFDSVLDPADWIFGIWMKNLQDTDKMFDAFCRYCYLAGKEKCKLWKDSPHAIATAFDQALSKLAESPIAVPGNDIMGPQIVTYTDLKRMFVTKAIYSPWKGFPLTAEFVHDILEGNGTSFATYKNSRFDADFRATAEHVYSANTACLREGPYSQACQVPNEPRDERSPAIWCLEASDHHLKKSLLQRLVGGPHGAKQASGQRLGRAASGVRRLVYQAGLAFSRAVEFHHQSPNTPRE